MSHPISDGSPIVDIATVLVSDNDDDDPPVTSSESSRNAATHSNDKKFSAVKSKTHGKRPYEKISQDVSPDEAIAQAQGKKRRLVDNYTRKLKRYQNDCANEIAKIQHRYMQKINQLHKSFEDHDNNLQNELDGALEEIGEVSVDLREISPDWDNLRHRPLMRPGYLCMSGITVDWENRLKNRHIRSADQSLTRAEEELRTIALSLAKPYSKELITVVMSMEMVFLPEFRRVWRGFRDALKQNGFNKDLVWEYTERLGEFNLFQFLSREIQVEEPYID